MFNKAKNPQTSAETDHATHATPIDREAYRRQLAAMIEENSAEQARLKRELERQQSLLAAAIGMEGAAKDRLKSEQESLNSLEEQSRVAILALAEAKQHSDRLTDEYNRELERVKELRSQVDRQSAELADTKATVKRLMDDLGQQSFFGSRQARLLENLADTEEIDLPPLSDLVPIKASEPAPQKAEKNHANADFWEKGSRHTALKISLPDQPQPETKPAPAPEPEPKSKLHIILSYIICVLLAVSVALAIRTWVLMPTEVSGSSMSPTLISADKLLTSPVPYLLGEPERGDIIVFQAPNEDEGVFYVKRVIGLPGERVLIEDGLVYIDGKPLTEPYLVDTRTEGYIDTIVPKDSVFVLGDNRLVSHDSRSGDVACIAYDEIYGKAVWRLYPFESFGSIY